MVAYANLFHRGLLAWAIALMPYLGAEALEKDFSTHFTSLENIKKPHHRKSGKSYHQRDEAQIDIIQELELQLAFLLTNETVFFHDIALATLDLTSPASTDFRTDNERRLTQNANILAQVIYPNSPTSQEAFVTALTDFIHAGENYIDALQAASGNSDNPTVVAVLRDQWLPAADALAVLLSQLNPRIIFQDSAQRLLEDYTLFLANMINRLAPVFTGTLLNLPDFTGASLFYTQARILVSQDLASLIAKALTPPPSRHRDGRSG